MPRPAAAEPVAGSSAIPPPGTNTREWTVSRGASPATACTLSASSRSSTSPSAVSRAISFSPNGRLAGTRPEHRLLGHRQVHEGQAAPATQAWPARSERSRPTSRSTSRASESSSGPARSRRRRSQPDERVAEADLDPAGTADLHALLGGEQAARAEHPGGAEGRVAREGDLLLRSEDADVVLAALAHVRRGEGGLRVAELLSDRLALLVVSSSAPCTTASWFPAKGRSVNTSTMS